MVKSLEGSLSHFMVDGQDGFLLMLNDISARLANEERLTYLAQHDPLTELPNRALFMDRLEAAIRRHARAGSTFALIFVDLDGFKHVNDAFGHQYGDQMLRACVRESDSAARLGGDEFAVLFEPINSVQEARNTVAAPPDAPGDHRSTGRSSHPGGHHPGSPGVRRRRWRPGSPRFCSRSPDSGS